MDPWQEKQWDLTHHLCEMETTALDVPCLWPYSNRSQQDAMEKQRKTVEGYRSDVQEIGISVAFIL